MSDLKDLSTSEMAYILDLTDRGVRDNAENGRIPARRAGKQYRFDAREVCRAYFKKKSNEDLEQEKLAAEVELKQAKAEQEKLALAELQGQMHRAEYVEQMTEQFMLTVRSMLMALPGRVAVDIAGMDSAEEISVYMRDEVNQIFDGLSDFTYDPEAYAQLVRENKGWRSADESGDEES